MTDTFALFDPSQMGNLTIPRCILGMKYAAATDLGDEL